MICNECETVAHCSKHGCIPKRDFWEGYVPEQVKPATEESLATQAQQALDKKAENARELGLDYEPARDSGIVTAGGADPRTQRTWVGLTDEEVINVMPDDDTPMSLGEAFSKFAELIEAKLKEKNT